MIDPLYTSAFLMGLIGSGHCLAMCGGIASSLQLASNKRQSVIYSFAYNLGRACSYMLAGALVAGISSQFAKQNTFFFCNPFIHCGYFYAAGRRVYNALRPHFAMA
jgi:hypothetical protein